MIPSGGYREDRRNNVTPYTYLDYGSYYSFGPTYDSSASHCTPESNQLLLGTTWLPGRTPYVLGQYFSNHPDYSNTDVMDLVKDLSHDDIECLLQKTDDQTLVQSLIMAQNDQKLLDQLNDELEQILPHPDTSVDCVYSICLANILTKNYNKTNNNNNNGGGGDSVDLNANDLKQLVNFGNDLLPNENLNVDDNRSLIDNTNRSGLISLDNCDLDEDKEKMNVKGNRYKLVS